MERLMLWMCFDDFGLFLYHFRVELSRGQRCAAAAKKKKDYHGAMGLLE